MSPKPSETVLRGFSFEAMQYPSDYDYHYERERDALAAVLTAYLEGLEMTRGRG